MYIIYGTVWALEVLKMNTALDNHTAKYTQKNNRTTPHMNQAVRLRNGSSLRFFGFVVQPNHEVISLALHIVS